MKIQRCPECNQEIIHTDNNVNLDYPAQPYDDTKACWTLMNFGSTLFASVGNPGMGGKGHTLHEHQPEGSVMNA